MGVSEGFWITYELFDRESYANEVMIRYKPRGNSTAYKNGYFTKHKGY